MTSRASHAQTSPMGLALKTASGLWAAHVAALGRSLGSVLRPIAGELAARRSRGCGLPSVPPPFLGFGEEGELRNEVTEP